MLSDREINSDDLNTLRNGRLNAISLGNVSDFCSAAFVTTAEFDLLTGAFPAKSESDEVFVDGGQSIDFGETCLPRFANSHT
jgi:hypothetical protein